MVGSVKDAAMQDAHEAIRPTDPALRLPSGLEPAALQLYQLIWSRFAASQMADAVYETLSA